MVHTGLFNGIWTSKLIALGLLVISLIGALGKKDEKLRLKSILSIIGCGLLLHFIGQLFFSLNASVTTIAMLYIGITSIGFLLVLSGGTQLSRLIQVSLSKDIFNDLNETFP